MSSVVCTRTSSSGMSTGNGRETKSVRFFAIAVDLSEWNTTVVTSIVDVFTALTEVFT